MAWKIVKVALLTIKIADFWKSGSIYKGKEKSGLV